MEDGTEPSQRVVRGTVDTLGAEAQRDGVKSPGLVFVEAHVVPRAGLAWFKARHRPATGRAGDSVKLD